MSGELAFAIASSTFALGFALGGVAHRHLGEPIEKCIPAEPRKAARPILSHPLGCEATMHVTVGGVLTQRPGCWVRTTPQAWL